MVTSATRRRCAALVLAAIAVVAGCGGSADDDVLGDLFGDAGTAGDAGLDDLDSADFAEVPSVDRRPAVLSELGAPDAFVITVDEIDGVVSRFESWSYYEARTQIDFVDGELLWDMETEAVPEGSWLPITFSPTEFTMLADVDDTMATLADVELTHVDATDTDVEGADLWAGEQLLLGFVDGLLVYVETFALAPVDPEVVP